MNPPDDALTFRARDFRILEHLDWTPRGVCLLAGPNGSGKTTALNALAFLRSLFAFGHEAAFSHVQAVNFRRLGIPSEAAVEFEVAAAEIVWKLRFPMSANGLSAPYGEELYRGDALVMRAEMSQDYWWLGKDRLPRDETRCCAKVLWDRGESPWMRPLVDALSGLRIHRTYWLNQIQRLEPATGTDVYLHPTGRNLWSVLANWKASPMRFRGQFDWVLAEARAAFPDQLQGIEFDRGLPYLFRPGASDITDGLPPFLQADGLLTGLAHLTAVAGARNGSLVAFDELESHLHPHAIRSLIDAMRRRAETHDLTIVLTTHSPVVLNEFKGHEDRIYVLERGWQGSLPVPLDELHSEAWLSHFALGDLYEREQFAAPRPKQRG